MTRLGMGAPLALLLAGVCTWTNSAVAAETAAERGKRVVDEAVQALGGDAFLHMNNRVESGRMYSFYNARLSGLSNAKIYTRYLDPKPAEARLLERESYLAKAGKEEQSAVLLTEKNGWEITFRGARPLEDVRYVNFQDSTLNNVLYILRQRLQEPELSYYSQGSDRYENRPIEIVDITDSRGRTVTVYFDQRTKLPVRQSFRRRNPEFKDFDTEVTIFGLYRSIDGVMWPCNIRRERNGEKIFEMFSDQVEMNKTLPDTLFALPGEMKVLPKAK